MEMVLLILFFALALASVLAFIGVGAWPKQERR